MGGKNKMTAKKCERNGQELWVDYLVRELRGNGVTVPSFIYNGVRECYLDSLTMVTSDGHVISMRKGARDYTDFQCKPRPKFTQDFHNPWDDVHVYNRSRCGFAASFSPEHANLYVPDYGGGHPCSNTRHCDALSELALKYDRARPPLNLALPIVPYPAADVFKDVLGFIMMLSESGPPQTYGL